MYFRLQEIGEKSTYSLRDYLLSFQAFSLGPTMLETPTGLGTSAASLGDQHSGEALLRLRCMKLSAGDHER
jgi:hypothetical protein